MRRFRKHRLTLAAVAAAVGILAGGLEISREVRGLLREHREHLAAEAQRQAEFEMRLCALEGGRWWRGDCRGGR